MQKRLVTMMLIALATTGLMVGCASGPKTGEDFTTKKDAAKIDVSWASEPTGTLTVTNDIDEPLILFAGSISNNHIIGGIKGLSTRSFLIFDDLPSGQKMGTFLLRAIKESAYRGKGSNYSDDDVIYGHIISYDSNDKSMKTNITIQKRNGGDGVVYFENDSNLVVELRLDSPEGETIAVLPPFQRKKLVQLVPDVYGYTYFPVYRYYDKKNNMIQTISTTDLANGRNARPVVPGSGEDPQFVRFPKPDVSKIFAPVFKVRVINETEDGVLLQSGSTPKLSERGVGMINSGSMIETFEFDMKNMPEREIGSLSFDLRKGGDKIISIPTRIYKAGYMYNVTLRKDYTTSVQEVSATNDMLNLDIPLVNERE